MPTDLDSGGRLAVFAAAPHRAFFFGGMVAALASMLWWWVCMAVPGQCAASAALPPGWAHALLLLYASFSFFIFGFLLTVYPRWMNTAEISRRAYFGAFLLMFAGFGSMISALLGVEAGYPLGVSLLAAGWLTAFAQLVATVWRTEKLAPQALLTTPVVLVGLIGLAMADLWWWTGEWQWMYLSLKFAVWGFLVPLFFAVSHRMLPFFAHCVRPDYPMYRPGWTLGAVAACCAGHLYLESIHQFQWLFLFDVPCLLICAWLWLAWRPWRCLRPALLGTLFVSFAWLLVALGLFAAQSLVFRITGEFVLGRAPLHALMIGFFTSMMVAMVTRVSRGHSGRPLVMNRFEIAVFLVVQLAALLRIAAEWPGMSEQTELLNRTAAAVWLLALAPWALRWMGIYWRPRLDGKPG